MEQILGSHTMLIAGLLEMIWFNCGLSRAELAYKMAGGKNVETVSMVWTIGVVLFVAVKLSITLVWWYFAVVIALFVIMAFVNLILFPILRLISFLFGCMLGFLHEAPCEELEIPICEIHGGRWLAALYTLSGGCYLLYYIFRVM